MHKGGGDLNPSPPAGRVIKGGRLPGGGRGSPTPVATRGKSPHRPGRRPGTRPESETAGSRTETTPPASTDEACEPPREGSAAARPRAPRGDPRGPGAPAEGGDHDSPLTRGNGWNDELRRCKPTPTAHTRPMVVWTGPPGRGSPRPAGPAWALSRMSGRTEGGLLPSAALVSTATAVSLRQVETN